MGRTDEVTPVPPREDCDWFRQRQVDMERVLENDWVQFKSRYVPGVKSNGAICDMSIT
ncbi:hypothetical protein QFZ21_001856 [Microbacterium sp. W4I20]|nr:hypothetical protein [Microbacterium sp. W4I20]